MGILEVACLGVKAGLNATDESTVEGQMALDNWSKAVAQPGAHAAYWGHEIENGSHLWGFMDWDTVEAHQTWQKNPGNAEVMAKLMPYMDPSAGPNFVKHVDVTPFPVAPLDVASGAGVCEVFATYFPADVTAEEKAKIGAIFGEFAQKALADPTAVSEVRGASSGWGVETDFPLPGSAPGEEGAHAVFFQFIGWSSLEAHKAFGESEAFKANVGLLATLPRLVKAMAVHVKCRTLRE